MAIQEREIRREGNREVPLGPKARRTRESVLAAAAREFARQGYQRTTMAGIATAAGVSLGTVYQYFRDRADVVGALVARHVQAFLDRADTHWRADEGVPGLERVIGAYITSVAGVADLARVWEEVSHVDDSLADLRRSLVRSFTEPVEDELRTATAEGRVRPDIDPAIAARALTGMIDRYCYLTYVFDPPAGGPAAPGDAARTLARLWAGAVGLDNRPSRSAP